MKWISVRDKLPNEAVDVIVVWQKFGTKSPSKHIGYIDDITHKWNLITDEGLVEDADNNPDYYIVTHWCEIPELPTH